MLIRHGLTVLLALWALTATANDLEKGFLSPPDSAKPWTFWWWLNGNISKEGITRDLEEMKRQGINGVVIYCGGNPAGPMPNGVGFLTTAWKDCFKHTLREADRLSMNVSLNLSDGYCCGGPWITPDQAIGNTNSRIKFSRPPTEFLAEWTSHGPTHHVALGVGHMLARIECVAKLLNLEFVRVC